MNAARIPAALFPVEAMDAADIDAIMAVEPRLFGDPWPRALYEYELTHNDLSFYCVIRGRSPDQPALLAYAGVWMLADTAHVATIGTHPDWQGLGLGSWMLLHLLEAARGRAAVEVTLEVRNSNLVAQGMYRKLGFEPVGRRRRYYRDTGEDAILMTLANLNDDEVQALLTGQRDATAARLRSLQRA